ncbi:response regulator [Marivirga salinae]|uniref:Response regulator n=1 Tax=Marivirga salinarum TaxID=3059078 RepID=A0AA51ND36_9BACT|nr:response regulator [Marivirga sp. BDSF4-3]WMN12744.1 response regulator [Marivirga sp. BDSF4-3]
MKEYAENSNNQHILLVDDNEINLLLAEKMIQRAFPSLQIAKASDGREAVELYKKTKPDVILMDVQMPEMNGFEATKEIRSLEKNSVRTPIIALTAGVYQMEIEECYASGMDNYINKPLKEEILHDLLQKWLKSPESKLPSIDFSRLDQLLKSDKTLYRTLLALALIGKNSIVSNYQILKKAVHEQDKTSIKYYSHKLKGIASSMCAENLYLYFEKIESSFENGLSLADFVEVDQEVMRVDQLLQQELENSDIR